MRGPTSETGEALDARARLVAWARGELGEQDPNKYFRVCAPDFIGREHEKAWCGVFCLAALHALELASWPWGTDPEAPGFVWRLDRTREPLAGDIAVFRFDELGRELWHHAIVERTETMTVRTVRGGPVRLVHTIDGNVLRAPLEGVAERVRPISENVMFYSIARLLRDSRAPTST